MGLLSKTGLLAATVVPAKRTEKVKEIVELKCDVLPAPFVLRPLAGIYNPFSPSCSILCNHPTNSETRQFVRNAQTCHAVECRGHYFGEDLSKIPELEDKMRTPHDIVTEDMFRRYTETDSRPLTPAPTVASGKSRGSRRCYTPDHPRKKTTIVLDLRRSHSQKLPERTDLFPFHLHNEGFAFPARENTKETIYYYGHGTSGSITGGHNEGSTLPSLNLSDTTQNRLLRRKSEHLPPLASPLVLSKRTVANKGAAMKTARNHLTRVVIKYAPTASSRLGSLKVDSPDIKTINETKIFKRQSESKRRVEEEKVWLNLYSDEFVKKLQNQLKALNLVKSTKGKKKSDVAKAKPENNAVNVVDENDDLLENVESASGSDLRRRGKRRKKGRLGNDRLTSAGLAAQSQQDPETQIAGIGSDSKNPSSRGSIAAAIEGDIMLSIPINRTSPVTRKTDSFLDDDILKFLHREVDEDAIQNEFDVKRRCVLEEALRTRPNRQYGEEMQNLLKEYTAPQVSLGDLLHIPRVFSRDNVHFLLPLHSDKLESLTPMKYAARYVSLKKSKQLLYLTVLRKFRPTGYRMPIKNIGAGLVMMMGGTMVEEQAMSFMNIMEWETYIEEEKSEDDLKISILNDFNNGKRGAGDSAELDQKTIKFKTWCGVCGVCERMYGRFPSRDKDPPDGIELSDFSMLETKLPTLKLHAGLLEILNKIRTR